MAKKFLVPLNISPLTSDPASGTEGDAYFNSSSNKIRIYYDAAWHDLAGGSGGGASAVTDLTDVLITSLADKNILSYDNATSLWKNKSLITAITEVDGASSGLDADLLDGQHGSYYAVATHDHSGTYQPLDSDLTAIAALTGSSGFLKTDGAGVWSVDTNSYLTSSSSLTASNLSGTIPSGVLGNSNVYIGTTAVALNRSSASLSLSGVSIDGNAGTVTNGVYTTGTYSNPAWITALAWSKVSSTPTTLSGYGITDAQPLDADLTAIAAISGTSGLLKKTAADTWTLDTNTYLTSNQSISITGDASGSGSTSISLTLANTAVTAASYGSATQVGTFTVDSKGRLTAAGNTTITPAFSSITSKPTTLSGYGITDAIDTSATAQTKSGNLSIGGDLTVTGNLTINGTTTTINSTTISVDDKNIELGSVASPTNTTADGGGITLRGTTDKTFNWVNSTSSWTSSEDIDLALGKVLRIAGTQVLSATQYTGNAATVTNGVYTTGSYSDPSWLTISKSKVGLGNVENTALSTWAGSTNITTLGIISSGTWNGSSISTTYTDAKVTSVNGSTGAITGLATTDSPTFTGTPLSTTAAINTDNTQIATTAFVARAIRNANILQWMGVG